MIYESLPSHVELLEFGIVYLTMLLYTVWS